jgi:hypothetical protein
MSIGESAGGLPPDDLVEHEADILEDMIRVIDGFHDPRPRLYVPGRSCPLLALFGQPRIDA